MKSAHAVGAIRHRLQKLTVPAEAAMTQREFAKIANVSTATISRFLRGKSLNVEDFFKVSAALGIDWQPNGVKK